MRIIWKQEEREKADLRDIILREVRPEFIGPAYGQLFEDYMCKDAFKRIGDVAEVLFVTTSCASNDRPKSFVGSVKTVNLEEAANLSLLDALQIWAKASQGLILIGDLKQSKPWTRRRFEGAGPKAPETHQ